jgi:hypothetical protein
VPVFIKEFSAFQQVDSSNNLVKLYHLICVTNNVFQASPVVSLTFTASFHSATFHNSLIDIIRFVSDHIHVAIDIILWETKVTSRSKRENRELKVKVSDTTMLNKLILLAPKNTSIPENDP